MPNFAKLGQKNPYEIYENTVEEGSLGVSQRIHHRFGHWNNIKEKKWSESGKERMFSKYMFLEWGASRSSMFPMLRFFDVFPREEDWYEWNSKLCHVFGWESMSHVLIHFRWLISAEGRATWPYVKWLNRWNPHSTIMTNKIHPAYIIHWSALNLREN